MAYKIESNVCCPVCLDTGLITHGQDSLQHAHEVAEFCTNCSAGQQRWDALLQAAGFDMSPQVAKQR